MNRNPVERCDACSLFLVLASKPWLPHDREVHQDYDSRSSLPIGVSHGGCQVNRYFSVEFHWPVEEKIIKKMPMESITRKWRSLLPLGFSLDDSVNSTSEKITSRLNRLTPRNGL